MNSNCEIKCAQSGKRKEKCKESHVVIKKEIAVEIYEELWLDGIQSEASDEAHLIARMDRTDAEC